MAQTDSFLKIDGIEGESKDAAHRGEIDVQGWTWGASQTGSAFQGHGLGAGKVQMQDLHITMLQSKASPKLFLACANGEHIAKAVLMCRKAGKNQQEYLKLTIRDFLISSYGSTAATRENPIPTDQITLNFSLIDMEYREQKPDGSLGGAIRTGWDLKQNVRT